MGIFLLNQAAIPNHFFSVSEKIKHMGEQWRAYWKWWKLSYKQLPRMWEKLLVYKETVDWINCIKCHKWLHELCTMFGDLCNVCGNAKIGKYKKKNIIWINSKYFVTFLPYTFETVNFEIFWYIINNYLKYFEYFMCSIINFASCLW